MTRPPKGVEFLARGLVRRGEEVLVCRNRKHGHLFLPGGHVEPGEGAAAALAREWREECGGEITVGPPLLCWESRFLQRGTPKHEFSVVFHVEQREPMGASAPVSLEEHLAFEWVDITALPASGFQPRAVAEWIRDHPQPTPLLDWLSIDELG